MLFNSLEFAAFMTVVLPLCYLTSAHWRIQNLVLIAAGYSGQGIPFSRIVFEQIAATHSPRLVILDVMAFSDDIDRPHALAP